MVFPQPWIKVGKSHCTTSLVHHHKTKFPTVYQTIYLPKWKFWIQLFPNYILIAYKSSHEKTDFCIMLTSDSEFNHIKCECNWYFSTVKKYLIFSLATDTICIFTVAKQWFLGNFGTGTLHFSKNFTRRMFVRNFACCDVNIKDNDVTVWPGANFINEFTTCFCLKNIVRSSYVKNRVSSNYWTLRTSYFLSYI